MDGATSVPVGQLWPNPADGVPRATLGGDQVWLEELIGPLSCQSSSSPGGPSWSAGGSRSSSSEKSWSSGATSVLHSSIKKQSQEAFRACLRAGRCQKEAGCPSVGPHVESNPQVEQRGSTRKSPVHTWTERVGLSNGRCSAQTGSCSGGGQPQWLLEEKLQAKLRFSKFLDEVTSNVLGTNGPQAFRKPASGCRFMAEGTHRPGEEVEELRAGGSGGLGSAAMQEASFPRPEQKKMPKEELAFLQSPQKTYLETDIDTVRTDGKLHRPDVGAESPRLQGTDGGHIIPPPPQFCQGFQSKSPFPELHCHFPRYPYKSVSLPRGINMVSSESLPKPGLGAYVPTGADLAFSRVDFSFRLCFFCSILLKVWRRHQRVLKL